VTATKVQGSGAHFQGPFSKDGVAQNQQQQRQIQQQITHMQQAGARNVWSGVEEQQKQQQQIKAVKQQTRAQTQQQQQASAKGAWSGAVGGNISRCNDVSQQIQHQHHGSHINPYFPPTNAPSMLSQTALNLPSASMPVTSALRWSGAVEHAALPSTSKTIAENNSTAVGDMHRRLVEEENLRLRERVMRLEAQMQSITHQKSTNGQRNSLQE